MKAEIIGIGTEILLGHIVNTNSAYLSKKLAELGTDLYYHTTVGDNPARLFAAINDALERADIVITTGGLGPTIDDITLGVLSEISGRPLILNKEILKDIKRHFKRRRIKMPAENIRQARIPEGARWLKNDRGTAPGIIIKTGRKMIIALPGPPHELYPIFERNIFPMLKNILPEKSVILTRTIKTTGLAESQVNPKVKDLLMMPGRTTVGIYAHPSEIELKITSKAKDLRSAQLNIKSVEQKIRKRLGGIVFGADSDTLESVTAALLKNKTIAIAESCTGGLLSSRLTDIPGMSKNLLLSVVAYSNRSKCEILDIPDEIIKRYGAVSAQAARLMAENVRKLACSDIGLAITGITGPKGAVPGKPVGSVYIALSSKKRVMLKEKHFTGDRKTIKFQSSQAALDMLRHHLAGK